MAESLSPDQGQTVSFLRPFWRRDLSTLRPPGVRMRVRNPWDLARFLFLGWYVRLGITILRADDSMDVQTFIITSLSTFCQPRVPSAAASVARVTSTACSGEKARLD